MILWLSSKISGGVQFIKNHQQILLTLLLMVVIPLAFLYSGQKFLKTARQNQERLEKDRIGLMHDAFVPLVRTYISTPNYLQQVTADIVSQNSDIEEFTIAVLDGSEIRVVSSVGLNESHTIDSEEEFYFRAAGLQPEQSMIFETSVEGVRHWKAVRAVLGDTGITTAFIFTDVSMGNIDVLFRERMLEAYLYLGLIILLILALLFNHARIIDYVALYNRLKETDQMKDDFLSMAAHELKTPLTAIRGYASLLNEAQNASDEVKDMTSKIDLMVVQLTRLIDDMLDVARLQQGRLKLNFEKVDIRPVLENVLSTLTPVAGEKSIELRQEATGDIFTIEADSDRLRQVLVNLVGNSIKYTPKGSVTVKVAEDRDTLAVRIMDTGIGISAENQEKLFSKFFRVQSRETKMIRGTGLGMWITQQLVKEMKGSIGVESIEGVGTHVIVRFPKVS